MIVAALTIVCLALVGLLVYREQAAKRDREAAQELRQAIERDRIEERQQAAQDRERAAEERRELYQRIQAPEIAVHDAQLEKRRERPYVRRQPVGADDDAAFAARSAERQAERDREREVADRG